jgi:hypothetical protein
VPVVGQDSASVLRHLYARGSGEKILIFTDMKSQGQFFGKPTGAILFSNGICRRAMMASGFCRNR